MTVIRDEKIAVNKKKNNEPIRLSKNSTTV